jgi:hypothetical protein
VPPESSAPAMMFLKAFMPAVFVGRVQAHIGQTTYICLRAAAVIDIT